MNRQPPLNTPEPTHPPSRAASLLQAAGSQVFEAKPVVPQLVVSAPSPVNPVGSVTLRVDNRPLIERNLEALSRRSEDVAAALREVHRSGNIEWIDTPEGPSAIFTDGFEPPRALASKRSPATEGKRWAQTIDLQKSAGFAIMGFGLGYHVAALASRVGLDGAICVFEPDLAMLREVLETIDYTELFSQHHVTIISSPSDKAQFASAVHQVEGLMSIGTRLLDHPSSLPRMKPYREAFQKAFMAQMDDVRLTTATTLMQMTVTIRNMLQNIDHYALRPGIESLKGAFAGRPAITVAAGPSLAKNIHLLKDPSVRERVVIVAAQTALKPLLLAGIKPHFVTALDYHEISARFYEGLTAQDLEGVTLIVEPKVNPAVTSAWPGTCILRCAKAAHLDMILGSDLTQAKGEVQQGSTVAHLSYYLARYLGCEPVALIGQDLGFTGNRYYGPGAAIHQTWSAELNPFRTLEMLEWERIIRHRWSLSRHPNAQGKQVYSDTQMTSYLSAFTRMFAQDIARGLTVFDATEGGVSKAPATAITLAEFLARNDGARFDPISKTLSSINAQDLAKAACITKDMVRARVSRVKVQIARAIQLCDESEKIIAEIIERPNDQPLINGHITRLEEIKSEVVNLVPAWPLINTLNQIGMLNRVKADRALRLTDGLSPQEVQARQAQRDKTNVRWMREAAELADELIDQTITMLDTGARITRDPTPSQQTPTNDDSSTQPKVTITSRIVAIVGVHPTMTGTGLPRALDQALVQGKLPLEITLGRLLKSAKLSSIIIASNNPAQAQTLAGKHATNPKLIFAQTANHWQPTRPSIIGAARAFARQSWRGGLGSQSIWDELLDSQQALTLAKEANADAIALVGPDFVGICPDLLDEAIARYQANPKGQCFTFAPGAVGLCPGVVSLPTLEHLVTNQSKGAGCFATLGGLLSYLPIAPNADPLGRHSAVPLTTAVRNLAVRLTADDAPAMELYRRAITSLGADPEAIAAETLAQTIQSLTNDCSLPAQQLELHISKRLGQSVVHMPRNQALEHIRAAASARQDVALSLCAHNASHPDLIELIRFAHAAGIHTTHVRTNLLTSEDRLREIVSANPQIISADLFAVTHNAYRKITGGTLRDFETAQQNFDFLRALQTFDISTTMPSWWLVPRIARHSENLDELEGFYDRWIMELSAAVIDPMEDPLPLPSSALKRSSLLTRVI